MHEQRFYREPLLMVLGRVGGRAARPDVLTDMADLLEGELTDDDRVPMDDRPTEEGWRNRTSWEVKVLKEQGILLSTTTAGRGVWALSEMGQALAAELERNTRKAGIAYDTPARPAGSAAPEPFEVDPDLVDRGRAAHHDAVDALASWVIANGLVPLLPLPDGPLYDLAWFDRDDLHVAEVKKHHRWQRGTTASARAWSGASLSALARAASRSGCRLARS